MQTTFTCSNSAIRIPEYPFKFKSKDTRTTSQSLMLTLRAYFTVCFRVAVADFELLFVSSQFQIIPQDGEYSFSKQRFTNSDLRFFKIEMIAFCVITILCLIHLTCGGLKLFFSHDVILQDYELVQRGFCRGILAP